MEGRGKLLTMMKRLPKDCVYDLLPNKKLGNLVLIASNKGLHALLFDLDTLTDGYMDIIKRIPRDPKHKVVKETKRQLNEYFRGKRKEFDIPLVPDGTDFQNKAWKKLLKIPYGQTISYQEQAISLGGANKVRAVGSANGRNPLSIIVPCHRVIGKDGGLYGFGGGLDAKKYLLELEKKNY